MASDTKPVCDTFVKHAFKKGICNTCFNAESAHAGAASAPVASGTGGPGSATREAHALLKRGASVVMDDATRTKFRDANNSSIEDQAKIFLRAFVMDFLGNFEEVLTAAREFAKLAPTEGVVRELEEDVAHRFLEMRGETMTVAELRDYLQQIDLDKNRKISFLEYLLWKYQKTVNELFAPVVGASPEMLADLEKAIQAYEATVRAREAREQKMAALAKQAEAGGVKGMSAAAELEAMKNEDLLEANRAEVTNAAKKRKIQKEVDKGDWAERQKEKAVKEEQARVEAEKKAKADAEAKERAEKRAKMAERAAQFGPGGSEGPSSPVLRAAPKKTASPGGAGSAPASPAPAAATPAAAPEAPAAAGGDAGPAGDTPFKVGDAVVALFREDGQWYNAIVQKASADKVSVVYTGYPNEYELGWDEIGAGE